MYPEQTDPSIAAAVAVARRLVLRAINIRFDLDEALESATGCNRLTPSDLRQLRAEAGALQQDLDHLSRALHPLEELALEEALEEESDEAMV